jgi:hypothetical protein
MGRDTAVQGFDGMIATIRRIGDAIARRMGTGEIDPGAFAECAESALAAEPRLLAPDWCELARDLASAQAVRQDNSGFSDAPITLYRTPDFCIELLHWLHATTSIHEHSFSGAFVVLAGSSLHTRYRVVLRDRFDDDLTLCHAETTGTEFLKAGSIRRIDEGSDGLVHSLYHLDSPTITLVLRTHAGRDQFGLIRPALWLNELRLIGDGRLRAIERLIHAAERGKIGYGHEVLRSVADRLSDAEWVFLLMRQLHRVTSLDEFDRLLCARQSSSTSLDAELRAAYPLAQVCDAVHSARASVADPELRTLLALLLNVSSRGEILSLVERVRPGQDAAEVLAQWLVALSRFRGDPVQRLARLAAASSADFRIGVELKHALSVPVADDELLQALAAVVSGRASAAENPCAVELASRLAAVPAMRALLH